MEFSMFRPHLAITMIFSLGLISCSAHSHPVTRSDAMFLSASGHQLIVGLSSQGDFTNSRSIPLDTNVVVIISGRQSNLGKLQSGQSIRITRDDVTHEVVGIDAR